MNVLICWSVKDLPIPHKESIRGHCAECGEELWMMAKNAKLELSFLCHACGQDFVEEKSQKEPVVLLPAIAAHTIGEGDLQKLEEQVKKAIYRP